MFGRILLYVLVFAGLPIVALAQEGAATTAADPPWVDVVIAVLSAIAGSGLISTLVSSDRWWMKLIDAVALNWGKARNDSRVQ